MAVNSSVAFTIETSSSTGTLTTVSKMVRVMGTTVSRIGGFSVAIVLRNRLRTLGVGVAVDVASDWACAGGRNGMVVAMKAVTRTMNAEQIIRFTA